MKIYIPSMGRAGVFGTRQMTVDWLKGVAEPTLIVPDGETARYRAKLTNMGIKAEVVGCVVEGIAETRRFIGKLAKKRGESTFCMMDDDLNFCVRKGTGSFHLRPAKPEDVAQMVRWVADLLTDYAHASVSPRQANNQMPDGDRSTLIKTNKRTLRLLAYQTDAFLAMKHGRVPVMEDFDVNLQLLRSGRPNIVTYWWAQDQRETGSAGGCSSYRTLEAHNAAAEKLAELHAPFVKLREKVNVSAVTKTAKALATRTEVTIYWEKAFQSSQKG